jgi:hypothetical protein
MAVLTGVCAQVCARICSAHHLDSEYPDPSAPAGSDRVSRYGPREPNWSSERKVNQKQHTPFRIPTELAKRMLGGVTSSDDREKSMRARVLLRLGSKLARFMLKLTGQATDIQSDADETGSGSIPTIVNNMSYSAAKLVSGSISLENRKKEDKQRAPPEADLEVFEEKHR